MRLLVLAHLFLLQARALLHNSKRAICNVASLNDPLLDDVPNILSALEQCGDTGSIVLPKNTTFHIRSPLDLSLCKRCDFQVNGILKLSPDWNYWKKQSAVFKMSNASNVMMSSEESTGIIEANDFGWELESGVSVPDRMPVLFSVSDGSYQIYIRNLKIRNAPGTVFHVNSGSSAVRIYGIDIQSAATTGYLVEDAQHVYLYNDIIHTTGSCIAIAPNATNIQVEESTCLTSTLEGSPPNGVEIKIAGRTGLNWIRNIFVKRFEAIGWMNVVAFTAPEDAQPPLQITEIKNATFVDVNFSGTTRQAVYLGQHNTRLAATDITFRDFRGIAQYKSVLQCVHEDDLCEFKQEGWNVTVKG